MGIILENLIQKAGNTVRHWWLILLSGILSVIAGIIVFCNPVESYISLSIFFGIVILLTGIIKIVTIITSRNYFLMRNYSVIGGIFDLLTGIFLLVYPQMTLVILPLVLGIWMLYHGVMIVSLGGDMRAFEVPGHIWTTTGGIILMILSILIIINPLHIGTASVVLLTGTGLVCFGIILSLIALKLRKIHKYFKYEDVEEVSE